MVLYTLKNTAGTVLITYKEHTRSAGYMDFLQYYDECKIVRIMSGRGVWEVNGVEYPFEKDDIFLFSRCDVRRLFKPDMELKIAQINFIPPAVSPHGRCTDLFFIRKSGFSNKLSGAAEIARDFDKLREYVAQKDMPYRDDLIQNTVCRAVITAAQLCGYADRERTHDSRMDEVMLHVSKNLGGTLTTGTTAQKFGFSPEHFSRLFKASAGIPFNEYVARCRVNAVINEMGANDINVLDAAFKYGFRSSSGFYKAFERVTGCRPKDFRKGQI